VIRLLLIVLFLSALSLVTAQETKVINDLHLWTGAKIEKTFAKDWTISLEQEIRFKHNISEINNTFTEAGLSYRISKNFALWDRFLQDSTFIRDVRNRWQVIRENQFRDDSIIAIIDSLSMLINEPQQRNFKRWNIIGRDIWPNYYVGESYEDEIDFLKTWTLKRLQWLDDKLYDWTSVENLSADYGINVYPNPFSDNFHYSFSLSRPGDISLTLYDINGRQVSNILNDIYYPAGAFTIDWRLSEIPGSLYVLILKIDGKIVSIRKLVKL